MTSESFHFSKDELHDLAAEMVQGTLDQRQLARLETLLASDPAARREYLNYMLTHAELFAAAEEILIEASAPQALGDLIAGNVATETRRPAQAKPSNATLSPLPLPSLAVSLAALLLVTLGIFAWNLRKPVVPLAESSYYDHRQLPMSVIAFFESSASDETIPGASKPPRRDLTQSTLRQSSGESHLAFVGGAAVRLDGPTVFGLESGNTGVLLAGSVSARLPDRSSIFTVQTPHVRVVDKGADFRLQINEAGDAEVEAIAGQVEVQTRVRLPRYYWQFDDQRPLVDLAEGLPLILGAETKQVDGLIGAGALEFNNAPNSFAEVVGGTGAEVGTGGFAATHGVTIEVYCTSRWTGEFKDYDEIFRKEDGDYRILLSFQNDDQNYDVPKVQDGPCLSFGLHLADHGYSELDMPLDGKQGRPTVAELTDGRPHHIAATYDCFSGRKAIYVDGRLRYEHTFPEGTLILSGGPAPARIGNLQRSSQAQGSEPYFGVIDELAFYDFALTSKEVAAHYQRVSQGLDYFGIPVDEFRKSRWILTSVVSEGESKQFRAVTSDS
ncbi:MAG: LamG-like jellyroll fold domain-containing protein [Blastopirellula sp. JB062]